MSTPLGELHDDQLWQTGRLPSDGWYYVRGLSEDKPVYLRIFDEDGDYGVTWGNDESDDPEAVEMGDLSSESLQWRPAGRQVT